MDSTSYRSNRQATQNPAANEPETSSPVSEAPAPERVERGSKAKPSTKRPKPPIKIIGAVVAVILLALAGWWILSRPNGVSGSFDSNKMQAVFFTNGQVYFGKLHVVNQDYMKLTNIYYLQAKNSSSTKDNPQQTSSGSTSDVQLIKLGDEIHGPEDAMVFNKDQILFFENLKKDGNVSKTIANYQQNK